MEDAFIRGLVPGALVGILIALYFMLSKGGYRYMMRMQMRMAKRRKAVAEATLPALEGGLDAHKAELQAHLEGSGYTRLDVGKHDKPGQMLFTDRNKTFGPQYSYELEEKENGIHVVLKQVTGHLRKGNPEFLDKFLAHIQPAPSAGKHDEVFEDLN